MDYSQSAGQAAIVTMFAVTVTAETVQTGIISLPTVVSVRGPVSCTQAQDPSWTQWGLLASHSEVLLVGNLLHTNQYLVNIYFVMKHWKEFVKGWFAFSNIED